MMSNVGKTNNNVNKSFLKNNHLSKETEKLHKSILKRNNLKRKKQLDVKTGNDAKVDIPNTIRDFSKIKKIVDSIPHKDNSKKIEALKNSIKNGTYKVNYDELANKILSEEFKG
jgi:negative regulator of flagellin synthesis FlgM